MSTTTATPKRRFADLLVERYERADESQRQVAEWLQAWMREHDLETELAEIERTAPDDLRDETMDAIAVIRTYVATNSRADLFRVGQAAVSKWVNGGAAPTPEKWVALSRYLGLPLAELHRLVVFAEMPESVITLQQRLATERKVNRDLLRDLEQTRRDLTRAARLQRDTDEELARLRAVAGQLERERGAVSVS